MLRVGRSPVLRYMPGAPRPDHPGGDRAFVPASRQTSLSSDDIKKTMKEIPNNTAGEIVLTGHLHLRAKRPVESVRTAGAFIVAQGMLTPNVLAEIIKRDGGGISERRAGRRPDVPVRGWYGECGGGTGGGGLIGGVFHGLTLIGESAVTERGGRLEKRFTRNRFDSSPLAAWASLYVRTHSPLAPPRDILRIKGIS